MKWKDGGAQHYCFQNRCFYSIMLDEASDVYRKEQVILFGRFSINGKAYTKFVVIRSVIRDVIINMLQNDLNWKLPERVL